MHSALYFTPIHHRRVRSSRHRANLSLAANTLAPESPHSWVRLQPERSDATFQWTASRCRRHSSESSQSTRALDPLCPVEQPLTTAESSERDCNQTARTPKPRRSLAIVSRWRTDDWPVFERRDFTLWTFLQELRSVPEETVGGVQILSVNRFLLIS